MDFREMTTAWDHDVWLWWSVSFDLEIDHVWTTTDDDELNDLQ